VISSLHHSFDCPNQKELLSIDYCNDRVYEYGVSRDLDTLNLVNGDVIELSVNRSANVVTWLTNGCKIG